MSLLRSRIARKIREWTNLITGPSSGDSSRSRVSSMAASTSSSHSPESPSTISRSGVWTFS
ncbi:MAG TPA: hypothetical protein DD658_04130 [Deltaproteobacteria bacterium]|nr:hypothetical protein [Deltaproteobacteria bacterium]